MITSAAPCQPAQATLAETLFQEGKRLLQGQRYAEACPKLQESLRLDPATGTLIALAICHEGEGKTATAWAEFSEAAASAARQGRADRVAFAQERAQALAPQLSRLVVSVPPEVAQLPGLQVKRDGMAIGTAIWGSAIPVDPGVHRIEASAPRMQTWSSTVEINPHRKRETVKVPALQPLRAAPPADPGLRQLKVAWFVGGAGIIALGVGGYFGVRAIRHHDTATSRCSQSHCTDPEAVRLNDDAKVSANIANVGVGLGLAGLAASAILVLSAPKRPNGVTTSFVIGPNALSVVMTR